MAAILIYCLIYPLLGNYVVTCAVEQATGHPCIGCGLTRGIHQALLFDFTKAAEWNPNSLLVFSFITITLALRIVINFVINEKNRKVILITDIIFSAGLYLFCFRHFFTSHILK